MANNANVNKVIYGGSTLIDLTGDTVASRKMLIGTTAHSASGASISGSINLDDDTVLAGEALHALGLTFYVDNEGYICQRIEE